MIGKAILGAGIMIGIGVLTILHMPRSFAKLLMRIPAGIQALIIHFGYGTWVGGVTGHIMAGLMSAPWFFISHYWLRPKFTGKEPTSLKLGRSIEKFSMKRAS